MPTLDSSARPAPPAVIVLLAALLAAAPPAPAARRPAPLDTEPARAAAADRMRLDERYGRLPMAFEPNLGQTDPSVRFLDRGRGYSTFVTDTEVVLALAGPAPPADARLRPDAEPGAGPAPTAVALRMRVAGGREPDVRAGRELEGRSNYLTGQDESTWLRDVPTYAEVRWAGVYEGVDAVFYGTQSQLEYDFVVAPGADASQIRVRFEGQQSAELDDEGQLVLRMEGGEIRQLQPVAFQPGPDGERRVAARCVPTGDGEVGFEIGAYDPSRPLVVDPALVYAKYIGGAADQLGSAMVIDTSGAAYVFGYTTSTGFPTTSSAFDRIQNGGGNDAFVTMVAAAGNALVYSTYLGGAGHDFGSAIAVDSSGAAYVAGRTTSTNFPTTAGAFDTTFGGSGDAFVTKLSSVGDGLVYSTYLGGVSTELSTAVAVDASGAAYVSGYTLSADFPTTPGAHDQTLDGVVDVFVTKLSTTGAALVDSTMLGGSGSDRCFGMAVDASGAAYVVGQTTSPDFATTGLGSRDGASVFVAKLTTTATTPGADTVGIYLGSTGSWFLRNSNSPGGADVVFGYGPSGLGWTALSGDWNGDGVDTPGLYDPSSSFFSLRNANSPGAADTFFGFGPGGLGWKPIAGDWDGDGDDTIGLYDPSSGFFYLRQANAPGPADAFFGFGPPDAAPLVGDWDGQ